ncbi:MAG: GNAT family N-acetyltransferase [Acidiferrobacterales bacterium]|nr:GNAT family N-acetyltransferase [Acidiferrobacterales bacterium]
MFKQEIIQSINQVSAYEWNRCVPSDSPFLRHEFLNAMEQSGCVSEETGWCPMHIVLRKPDVPDSPVAGALPLYRKYHSWGEFIFDWQWENAYFRHGLQYYPKLVSISPFTGLPAPKLLAAPDSPVDEVRSQLTDSCLNEASDPDLSSLHLLFLNQDELDYFTTRDLIPRRSNISFVWTNNSYGSMDDFLSTLSSRKRKKIRHERKSVREEGIQIKVIPGTEMEDYHWYSFHLCYYATTRKYDSFRYLNREFFQMIRESMPENLLLVLAERDNRPLASGLFYQGGGTLYGRYWGTLQPVSNLHFEICYYSAIEYCIENGFRQCHAGVQGAHKLSRGFLPQACYSAHMFNNTQFSDAIRHYTIEESHSLDVRQEHLFDFSPYAKIMEDKN